MSKGVSPWDTVWPMEWRDDVQYRLNQMECKLIEARSTIQDLQDVCELCEARVEELERQQDPSYYQDCDRGNQYKGEKEHG